MTDEGHRGRDAESTRATVIDAASRLFAERGFAATSMRDISAASGISHPLIHHHFGSKDDLYVAVKRHMVEGYARRFPVAARATNRPLSVRAEMRRLMTYLSENEVMFRLCAWARLEGDIKVWPGEPDLFDTLRSRIKAAQRRHLIRTDLDPAALSLMILGLIYFWVENRGHFAERFQGTIDDESFLRQAIALVELGVKPCAKNSEPTADA
ncbi:transcriptional regulator, TetR family [Singulisphaera sp. GP187]|uniref:TetR/AcrR family transcriptional regulator n=1 Tax=Singulisphaera sp. GP187 TaxID=1882752 RepID=UPI0009263BBD|nr:TetR/AcrR family transcriptional regulator [Singulisphaera sp. GP187]SIO28221.1 transcriptional regulator, TetR family [Singulisphaera sp. GP187]